MIDDRISDADIPDRFLSGDDIADLPFFQDLISVVIRREISHFWRKDIVLRVYQVQLLSRLDLAIYDFDIRQHPFILIIYGIEDQRSGNALYLSLILSFRPEFLRM